MFRTRMTELFGIEYPIQCGTMQALSRAGLVAAVAEAGALACLPAGHVPQENGTAGRNQKNPGSDRQALWA